MAGLSAPTAPILLKSSGNVQSNVNKLRTLRDPISTESASGLDNLQLQINQIVAALTNPGALTQLIVTNTKGVMIAWIGSRIVDGITYEGGWFEDLYIGGTGPADAVITATGGGVVVNGASIKLTNNGIETDINNETLPEYGSGVSVVSIDTSIAHGDQSFMAPQAFGVISWEGAAYASIMSIGDSGSGAGFLQLNRVGASDQITLNLGPPVITVFDGTNTTTIGSQEIITPLVNAAGYQVSGVPGVNLSSNVLTAASSTTLNYGTSLTVGVRADAVVGTPGAGQSNATVVNGVTLNLTSSGVVTGATSVAHAWSKGLLTT